MILVPVDAVTLPVNRARNLMRFLFFGMRSRLLTALVLALVPLTVFANKESNEKFVELKSRADRGDPDAQFLLGSMYADGDGVPEDSREALKWFRKAAESGLASAQVRLGKMYDYGDGVGRDSSEALKWFRRAAEQGDARGQNLVGEMYHRGISVPQDSSKAIEWFLKAAEQGDIDAQISLGAIYYFRKDKPRDYVKARKWFLKAAEHGDKNAQYSLGTLYYNGLGGDKNDVEAWKWFLLSSAQGVNISLELIGRNISSFHRDEGQRLAREFKPRAIQDSTATTPKAVGQNTRPKSSGTGFFITKNGYFITNQHVADIGAKVSLLTPSGLIAAKVVKVDTANDLSLLKAEGVFSALPLITSRDVRLGATVITVGFPNIDLQGFSPKLSRGEIASLAGMRDDPRHFQISVPIQPGNSGGALVDERGNVVGVVVARLSQKAALATSGELVENVNYALKSSYLLTFLESVPEAEKGLDTPTTQTRKFEDVVKIVEKASVMVLVY